MSQSASSHDVTLGYYDDDLARTISQDGTSTTLGLDSGGRRVLSTTTSTSGTTTLDRHYSDGSDNPAWTVSSTSGTTRYAESLGGDLSVTIGSDGAATLPLATLHGDVVTTVAIPAAQSSSTACATISGWSHYTEYGTPKDTTATATAAVAGTVGYGWLGAKQRSTTAETAGLTLMGDRLYNSATGRFTHLDPEPGGNANAYTYPLDPINQNDLNGRWGWGWAPSAWRWAGSAWRTTRTIIHYHYEHAVIGYSYCGGACVSAEFQGGTCLSAGATLGWGPAFTVVGILSEYMEAGTIHFQCLSEAGISLRELILGVPMPTTRNITGSKRSSPAASVGGLWGGAGYTHTWTISIGGHQVI